MARVFIYFNLIFLSTAYPQIANNINYDDYKLTVSAIKNAVNANFSEFSRAVNNVFSCIKTIETESYNCKITFGKKSNRTDVEKEFRKFFEFNSDYSLDYIFYKSNENNSLSFKAMVGNKDADFVSLLNQHKEIYYKNTNNPFPAISIAAKNEFIKYNNDYSSDLIYIDQEKKVIWDQLGFYKIKIKITKNIINAFILDEKKDLIPPETFTPQCNLEQEITFFVSFDSNESPGIHPLKAIPTTDIKVLITSVINLNEGVLKNSTGLENCFISPKVKKSSKNNKGYEP